MSVEVTELRPGATLVRLDRPEALRIGLVTDVVPGAELLDRAAAVAGEILLGPPSSVELTKRGMWAGVGSPSLEKRWRWRTGCRC